ncbi:hypothetical protein [Spiroplasma endosymbiont of Cleonymus obscurus]|uniref:hypothetical protein n=1 Tax=Spiroplasma endosymbiont of Cleonymus obscurus TaxID=3066324 RepID=UPI0037DC7A38
MLTHENNNKFLTPYHEWVFGDTTIWWNKWYNPDKTDLYFSKFKHHDEDVKWDGTYTDNYFE